MKQPSWQTASVRRITYIGILTALVFVLQLLGGAIRFGTFSISLVLLPIVLGAAIGGPLAGAWLGFVFSMAVFITGDANAFLAIHPFGTIVTVVLKGTLTGLLTGFVYRLIEGKHRSAAAITSAVVCPAVNTGIFLLGCIVFFLPTLRVWGEAEGFDSVWGYLLIGFVGLNFVFELAFNLILAPVLLRLLGMFEKQYDPQP